MKLRHQLVAITLYPLIVALVACGGGSTSTSAKTPHAVESAKCRSTMTDVGDMATTMEHVRAGDAGQFNGLLERLQVLQRAANGACSPSVVEPLASGVDKMSRAGADYTACQFVSLCGTQRIARDLVSGGQLIRQAVTASKKES